MLNVAWAQTAQPSRGPGIFEAFVVPLLLILPIFWFLIIRPQQKKVKEHREMLSKLKKNDEVITGGGIYGRVVALADDVVTVEVAPNVRIRVSRAQISRSVKGEKAPVKEAKEQ